jgi:hypothetical protein
MTNKEYNIWLRKRVVEHSRMASKYFQTKRNLLKSDASFYTLHAHIEKVWSIFDSIVVSTDEFRGQTELL